MQKPPEKLTLLNAEGIPREIYKAGQLISGDKRWWNKTQVGRYDFDKAKLSISKDENGYKMTGDGQIVYRFSDNLKRVITIDGQLIGTDIILRSIECGRARYQDGKVTLNTASPASSTFPAYLIGGMIEVHVPMHSRELQVRISIWEGFRTKVSVRCLEQSFRLSAVFLEVGYAEGTGLVPFLGLPYAQLQATVEARSQYIWQLTFDIKEELVYVSQYNRKEQRWVFPVEKLWSTIDLATRDQPASSATMLPRFELQRFEKDKLLWSNWLVLLLCEHESNRRLSPSCGITEQPTSEELPLPEALLTSGKKNTVVERAPNKLPVKAQEQLERYAKMYKETGGFNISRPELRDGFFRKHKICKLHERAVMPQMKAKLLEYITFYVDRKGDPPVAYIPEPTK